MTFKLANWPLPLAPDGRKPVVTSGFGYDPGRGYAHRGVDIFYPRVSASGYEIPRGTVALAALPGVVTKARLNYENFSAWADRPLKDKNTGYVVEIDHGNGLRTAAHHLSRTFVSPGQRVFAGQRIGVVGGSPNKLGKPAGYPGIVHLHWDIIRDGQFVDGGDYLNLTTDYITMPNIVDFLLIGGIVFVGLRYLHQR